MNDLPNRDDFHDSDEIEQVVRILRFSGIKEIHDQKVKGNKIDTQLDVLGCFGYAVLIFQCVGSGVKLGNKIGEAAKHFKSIIDNFDSVVDCIKETSGHAWMGDELLRTPRDKRKFVKILVSMNEETRSSIVNHQVASMKAESIKMWTREEVEYYLKISEATYDHCAYEIVNGLGLNPKDLIPKSEPYHSLITLGWGKKMGTGSYIVNLLVPIPELLMRSTMRRLRDTSEPEGYQRLLDKQKLRRMRKYLLSDDAQTYPNNIICVLNEKTEISAIGKEVKLGFPKKYNPDSDDLKSQVTEDLFLLRFPNTFDVFEIIDGQHRLFSYAQSRYAEFANPKKAKSEGAKDNKIAELRNRSSLVVTAIISNAGEFPSDRLFYDINTEQTRINPEDVLDLMVSLEPDSPSSQANLLLLALNDEGPLHGKIRTKFWQENRIKRTSLIGYGGINQIFQTRSTTHKIFLNAYNRLQGHSLIDFSAFCQILVNNYLFELEDSVTEIGMNAQEMRRDRSLSKYYLYSAVFVGALIKLMRHFLSEEDKAFNVLSQIDASLTRTPKSKMVSRNINNPKIRILFKPGLSIVAKRLNFTRSEFDSMGWKPNSWPAIEAKLFYLIRQEHPAFGDLKLLKKQFKNPPLIQTA